MPRKYTRRPFAERFWKHVDQSAGPDECWPWISATTPGGYGVFSMGGKTGAKGQRNGNAKLTEDDVRAIRRRCEAGEKQADIAADYGITAGLVSQIHTRYSWRHVE